MEKSWPVASSLPLNRLHEENLANPPGSPERPSPRIILLPEPVHMKWIKPILVGVGHYKRLRAAVDKAKKDYVSVEINNWERAYKVASKLGPTLREGQPRKTENEFNHNRLTMIL